MAFHILRRTLISLSRKNQPSKSINYPFIITPFSQFSSSFSNLATPTSEIKDYFITHHKFSEKAASKASTLLNFSEGISKSKIVLDYFKSKGFSDTQLEELVLCDPNVLVTDFVKYRTEKIIDLGFTDIKLVDLLCTVPGVLTLPRNSDGIISSISVLQNVLGSNDDVIRLLQSCNWFLGNDMHKVLLPNIKLLEDCGVSRTQIKRLIISFPRFFLIRPESISDCIRRVDEMGVSRSAKSFVYCVRALSSMSLESWESKLEFLRDMGFSDEDIMLVFRKRPHVLTVSKRKLLEILNILFSSEGMGVDVPYVVKNAQLLAFSVKGRIKPRLEIVDALKVKGLLTKTPKMTTVLSMTDSIFIKTFLLPYADEIGELSEKFIATKEYKL